MKVQWSILALLFLIIPGAAFAVQSTLLEGGDVLVRIPDQFLDANNFSVPSQGKVIVADLVNMNVLLYENGAATATYPILSKGRKGTPWETPSGVYQVLLKKKTHFSSLGHVFMPWSMQFYGNFFIHGWPYDVEGKDVPRGYSGGCVRLSTPDAEAVYHFVEQGTPVIVRAKDKQDLSGGYYVSTSVPPPELSAESFVVMDLDRGQVLWKKNAEKVFKDPLTGKYLSALASLEHMNQYTERNLPKGRMLGSAWFDSRSSLPAKDLIAPLLFSKKTSVEEVFAREHGRTSFLSAMQQKAKAFGMVHTTVHDIGGVGTSNQTTVTDMVQLLRALDQSKRYLLEVSERPLVAIPDTKGEEPTVVINTLLIPSTLTASRGGLADSESGNALFVYSPSAASGTPRSLAVALGKSNSLEEDITTISDYLSRNLTYVAGVSDGVVTDRQVGFFAKIRMIWNRKRIGDMLLGKEQVTDRTSVISAVFRSRISL